MSDELWDAAQKRMAETAKTYARSADGRRLIGHPAGLDRESPYLLTGFVTCAVCGNAMGGTTSFHGKGRLR